MGDAIPLLQFFKMPRPVGGVIHFFFFVIRSYDGKKTGRSGETAHVIKKLKSGFKSLFLLAILLVVSVLAALIGKASFNKNSNSVAVQSGLINSASADTAINGCEGSKLCKRQVAHEYRKIPLDK
jgi:hypothetical protein